MKLNLNLMMVGAGVCLSACAGASAPPQEAKGSSQSKATPADGNYASVDEEGSEDEASPLEAMAREAQGEPEPEPSKIQTEAVDKLTFQAAMQAVLNDYALIEALHLEKSGRIPLRIAGDIPQGVSLSAEERAVEVVSLPENPEQEPVLVFLKIELSSDTGRFRYRYDVEGIAGTSRVAPGDGKWILKSSRIQSLSR